MGVNQPGSKRTARAFKKYICCQGSHMRMLAIPFYTYSSFLFSYFALPFSGPFSPTPRNFLYLSVYRQSARSYLVRVVIDEQGG